MIQSLIVGRFNIIPREMNTYSCREEQSHVTNKEIVDFSTCLSTQVLSPYDGAKGGEKQERLRWIGRMEM